eukprot:3671510-Pleurochrysis_carterae.AAC.1
MGDVLREAGFAEPSETWGIGNPGSQDGAAERETTENEEGEEQMSGRGWSNEKEWGSGTGSAMTKGWRRAGEGKSGSEERRQGGTDGLGQALGREWGRASVRTAETKSARTESRREL